MLPFLSFQSITLEQNSATSTDEKSQASVCLISSDFSFLAIRDASRRDNDNSSFSGKSYSSESFHKEINHCSLKSRNRVDAPYLVVRSRRDTLVITQFAIRRT